MNKGKEITDEQLLACIREGHKKSFSILYYRYFNMLYSLSLRYLKNDAMAKDAVQQTFMRVWETRKHLDVRSSVSNYLYSITKNYILNQIRHNNRVIAHHYIISQTQDVKVENIIGNIEKAERFGLLREALQKLPERHRQVCLLKMREEMTNEQIAQKLQVSVSTVKLVFKQSKELLKGYLVNALSLLFFITLL